MLLNIDCTGRKPIFPEHSPSMKVALKMKVKEINPLDASTTKVHNECACMRLQSAVIVFLHKPVLYFQPSLRGYSTSDDAKSISYRLNSKLIHTNNRQQTHTNMIVLTNDNDVNS